MRKFVSVLIRLGIAAVTTIGMGQHVSAQEAAQSTQQPLLRGYYTRVPWTGGSREDAVFQAAIGATIPMLNYSFHATKDGHTYNGVMVGTSPFAPPAGTKISTVIVPLKVTSGGFVFDPTAANPCDSGVSAVKRFRSSPLVSTVKNLTINGVNVGTTQYINGFRRAEFWNQFVGSSFYQNTLSPVVTAKVESVDAGAHGIADFSGCGLLGIVSFNWLDSYLTGTLIPSLTAQGVIGPTKFVVFLLSNVVESLTDPPSLGSCCILGYHGATGNPVQTYSPMNWDTTGDFSFGAAQDASVSSHEIGEFMDDPLATNPTPAWGHIGQVGGCQGNLEVGDPLTGTLMPGITLGGKTYHVQELAFFSWYFNRNGVPSLGAGGKFSSNGTFSGPSKPCPPGGTF
jgi:hypothetical protein